MALVDLHDGELRNLQFGSLAFSRFELLICDGKGLYSIFNRILNDRPPFYVVTGLLWAGLNGYQSHEEICVVFDNYLKKSGDKFDGKIWTAIVLGLDEAGFFAADAKAPIIPPTLRDPEIIKDPESEIVDPGLVVTATNEQIDAKIEHLKKERRSWRREMGANL